MNQKTILLIDDDEDYLFQQKTYLENDGYKVVASRTRQEADEILRSGIKPDLAILDLMLEEMDDGFVLANSIKKIDDKIPVIMITAVISETGIDFTTRHKYDKNWIKADVILAKPIRYEQLKKEMERLIQ